jgi:hypothetical protein
VIEAVTLAAVIPFMGWRLAGLSRLFKREQVAEAPTAPTLTAAERHAIEREAYERQLNRRRTHPTRSLKAERLHACRSAKKMRRT